jgi:Glycosyltransferase family 87
VLALPFFFKPQDVLLVPVVLLVSGRWRTVAVFAATAAILAALSAVSLGPAGIATWLNDLGLASADPHTGPMTYSSLFGRTPLATGVEVGLGLLAVALAWFRRDRLDLVFALGLVGTTASATYLHEDDPTMLVLGAWILLRLQPSVTQRAWLIAGIAAAQFIAVGQPIPMLLWEAVWIALLGLEPRLKRLELKPHVGRQHVLSPSRE